MQIPKPVVPKKKCLSIFFAKMSLPQTVHFSISNFLYKLTQPNVHAAKQIIKKKFRIYLFAFDGDFRVPLYNFYFCLGEEVSDVCLLDGESYSSLTSGWALKMLDASGKLPPPGLFKGLVSFPILEN